MRRGVDAVRAAGDDGPAGAREGRAEGRGNILPVGGRGAGADERRGALPGQAVEPAGTLHPQAVRGGLLEVVEGARPLLVPGDQDPDPPPAGVIQHGLDVDGGEPAAPALEGAEARASGVPVPGSAASAGTCPSSAASSSVGVASRASSSAARDPSRSRASSISNQQYYREMQLLADELRADVQELQEQRNGKG